MLTALDGNLCETRFIIGAVALWPISFSVAAAFIIVQKCMGTQYLNTVLTRFSPYKFSEWKSQRLNKFVRLNVGKITGRYDNFPEYESKKHYLQSGRIHS